MKSCMFRRNRYLVENADLLLAVYDGLPGGTAMTVGYAREIGVPVVCLAPDVARAG
jgi:nucleoside 2-deoxyribosyltransferase